MDRVYSSLTIRASNSRLDMSGRLISYRVYKEYRIPACIGSLIFLRESVKKHEEHVGDSSVISSMQVLISRFKILYYCT